MFSKKLTCDNFTNLIAPRSTITGTVVYDGVLKVQGTISGNVVKQAQVEEKDAKKAEFTIIVDTSGHISSKVVGCKNAIIKGQLTAQELFVEETLRIHSSAKVSCVKIYYRTLEIEPGALLHDCQLIHLDHTSKGEQV
jgi:cytoskeletal protein CcmA (bactofilin family)